MVMYIYTCIYIDADEQDNNDDEDDVDCDDNVDDVDCDDGRPPMGRHALTYQQRNRQTDLPIDIKVQDLEANIKEQDQENVSLKHKWLQLLVHVVMSRCFMTDSCITDTVLNHFCFHGGHDLFM